MSILHFLKFFNMPRKSKNGSLYPSSLEPRWICSVCKRSSCKKFMIPIRPFWYDETKFVWKHIDCSQDRSSNQYK